MSEPFLGQIIIFAGTYAPRGWAFCNGQLLSIAQNSALYSLLGVTYGGDGRTTFALPDLRGRAPIHAGQGPGLSNHPLGANGGTETVTLDTTQIPSHVHSFAPHAINSTGTTTDPTGAYVAQPNDPGVGSPYPSFAPTTASNKVAMAPDVTATAGNSAAHPNLPPYLAVNYIIALQGIFPSRN